MFGKKKDMLELSEVQKRSINLPHGKSFVAKDGLGFVDLTKKPKLPLRALEKPIEKSIVPASQPSSFSFFDSVNSTPAMPSTISDNDESLRKISMQISDLDSKLYKLEQRIELLERKSGIDNSSTSSSSGFSW